MKVYFQNNEVADFDNSGENALSVEEIRQTIANFPGNEAVASANYTMEGDKLSFFITEKSLG